MLSFYKQQLYSSQIASKQNKITISFYMKNSKKNNITLGFSFIYLVSVYPTNRINVSLSYVKSYMMLNFFHPIKKNYDPE